MEKLKTSVINYGGGIYAIDQQMVRAFLIVGEKNAVLLDTAAVRTDIPAYIREITSLPAKVILTHGDGDHIGNLCDFPEAYINENDMAAVLSHEQSKNTKLLPLIDGDALDIGGRVLKVLFTPGHTAGSVCLLDEANKILFAGDTVSLGPVFMFGKRRNMEKYLSSLYRLKELADRGVYTTVYCCHNDCPIPSDVINDLIACVLGILNKTISGSPAPMPDALGECPLLCKYGRCMVLID